MNDMDSFKEKLQDKENTISDKDIELSKLNNDLRNEKINNMNGTAELKKMDQKIIEFKEVLEKKDLQITDLKNVNENSLNELREQVRMK